MTAQDAAAAHNQYQRSYYESRDSEAIRPAATPYVRRHLDQVLRVARLAPGDRVLEVGAGLGRYTLLLLEKGIDVVASDLSSVLLSRLQQAAPRNLTVLEGDVAGLADRTPERFSAAVGFFVLHHLYDLDLAFRGLAHVLRPGAPAVFCEPNAFNPLFYAQIALTPGMTWKGDGGIRRMRPSVVLPALKRAGLLDVQCERYGFLPPQLASRPAGQAIERGLERMRILEPLRAFQVFSGHMPRAAT